jgi:hypothetical protein
MKNSTTVERRSDRELVITRTFNGPARIVFEAWTTPELLKRWWIPKSTGMSLLSCTNYIPRSKLSTRPWPGWQTGCLNRSSNWTSFSSPWAREKAVPSGGDAELPRKHPGEMALI